MPKLISDIITQLTNLGFNAKNSLIFGYDSAGNYYPIEVNALGQLEVAIASGGLTEYQDGDTPGGTPYGVGVLGFAPDTGKVEMLYVDQNGALRPGLRWLTSVVEIKGYGGTALPYVSSIWSTFVSQAPPEFSEFRLKLRMAGTAGGTVHASIWGGMVNNVANFSLIHEFNQGIPFDPTGGIDFNEVVRIPRYYQYRLTQATGVTGSPNSSLHGYGLTGPSTF